MGAEDGWPPAPSGSPLYLPRDDNWTHFDNSVNAVSFGFVATAILICMFLVMAIFEKLLRTTSPETSPSGGRNRRSYVEARNYGDEFSTKLGYTSPKMSMNAREVSVMMPGDKVPSFIAHPAPAPAPVPCPPERMTWPSHQHLPSSSSTR